MGGRSRESSARISAADVTGPARIHSAAGVRSASQEPAGGRMPSAGRPGEMCCGRNGTRLSDHQRRRAPHSLRSDGAHLPSIRPPGELGSRSALWWPSVRIISAYSWHDCPQWQEAGRPTPPPLAVGRAALLEDQTAATGRHPSADPWATAVRRSLSPRSRRPLCTVRRHSVPFLPATKCKAARELIGVLPAVTQKADHSSGELC